MGREGERNEGERKKNEGKNKIKHRREKEMILISYIVLIVENPTGMSH